MTHARQMLETHPREIPTEIGAWAGSLVSSTPGRRAVSRGKCEALCASPGPVARDHSARFFFDRPLGRRHGFETLVRYRLPAFDREAVRPVGKARLRSLDRRQLSA